MMAVLKLLILTLMTIYIGENIGLLVTKSLNIKINKIALPYGIIAMLGMYEILMLIPLAMYGDYKFSYLALFLISLLAIFSIFKHWKESLFIFKSKYYLAIFSILLFCVVSIALVGSISDWKGDHNFYIGYVIANSKSWILNEVDMMGTGAYRTSIMYSIAGIYHLLGSISNLLRIDPYLVSVWYAPILYIILLSSTLFEAASSFTKKNYFILISFLIVFGYGTINDSMIANLFKEPILILIMLIYTIHQNINLKQSLFLLLCFSAGISVHSTFIFYAIIILFARGIYIMLRKEHAEYIPLIISSITIIIAAALTFNETFLNFSTIFAIFFTLMLISILLILLSYEKSKNIMYKLIKYIIIFIIISIYIGSFLFIITKSTSTFTYIDYFNELFSYNSLIGFIEQIIMWSICILFLLKYNNKCDFIYILLATIIGLFFNPFTIPVISTYLTSSVYFRLGGLLFSSSIILFILNKINNKYIIIIFIIVFCISDIKYLNSFSMPFDKSILYRAENDFLEITAELESASQLFIESNGYKPQTISTDFRAFYFSQSPLYMVDLYDWRTIYYEPSENLEYDVLLDIYNKLTKSKHFKDHELENIDDIILANNLKFVLFDLKQKDVIYNELNKSCAVNYQNETFILYDCQ